MDGKHKQIKYPTRWSDDLLNTPLRAVHYFESPHLWWGMLTAFTHRVEGGLSLCAILFSESNESGVAFT